MAPMLTECVFIGVEIESVVAAVVVTVAATRDVVVGEDVEDTLFEMGDDLNAEEVGDWPCETPLA